MPIRIDNELPAKQRLEIENIFVMSNMRADTQDIRPLKILQLTKQKMFLKVIWTSFTKHTMMLKTKNMTE